MDQGYSLLIHPAEEGGWWGEFLAVPGCFVQGETIDELLLDAPLALGSHFDALREDGQPVPEDGPLVLVRVQPHAA